MSRTPIKTYKEIRSGLLLVASSLLFALVLAEVMMRLFWPVAFMAPPASTNSVWKELLHRSSPVPGLAYELAPNKELRNHGALIQTNSFGMRDREPAPLEDSSVVRIVVLGDSFTFGFGVENDETYASVLEDLLNQRYAGQGKRFDVLNFGVGGYSTRDEATQLRHKGMAWKPDLVLIGYVLNDPQIYPVQPLHRFYQERVSWWQYSHVLRLMAKAKMVWDQRKFGEGDNIKYLHAEQGPMWPSVVEAFREIRDLVAYANTEVMVVIFPAYGRWEGVYLYQAIHQQVANVARENGFEVFDLQPAFEQAGPETLILAPDDGHPNPRGHALAAEEIYKRLLEVYPELLKRNAPPRK